MLNLRSNDDHLYRLLSGGRGYGKNRAQAEWLRAHETIYVPNLPRQVARKAQAPRPVEVVPSISSVRWACTSPTGHVSRSPLEEKYAEYTRGIVDALAGRPYNRKLIGQSHEMLGVRRP